MVDIGKQKPASGWSIYCCVRRINKDRLAQAATGDDQAGALFILFTRDFVNKCNT
ncbi:hypothetical protein [Nostoc sp. PCC 7524]|uniref:hypothetical protein n=1 Tax=Nostoc sp. (strain ATCC 29411 / PCC 7524) TaxID=28072 RepID=UPI000B21D057|nr:hypothetical protein [Nostoc sp. PCC 7524]